MVPLSRFVSLVIGGICTFCKIIVIVFLVYSAGLTEVFSKQYLGQLSVNQYDRDSVANPYSKYGNKYDSDSINNPYGKYGDSYSNTSVANPYATNAPKLYDSKGNYRGRLSSNPYDPDSVSNPYGKYGSEFSPDSINNPFGAGNEFSVDSPNNPYGKGWMIISDD